MKPTAQKNAQCREDNQIAGTLLRVCLRGHAVTTANAYIGNGRVQCRACRNYHTRRSANSPKRSLTEEKARRVLEALQNGECLSAITQGYRGYIKGTDRPRYHAGLRICHRVALKNFCKEHPKFGALVAKLATQNEAAAESRGYGNRPTRKLPARGLRSRRSGGTALEAVQRATRGVCETIRDDVQSEMLLAIAAGRLRPDDVAAHVSEYIAIINRANRHSVLSKFGDRSLDAPLSTETRTTLAETITQGLWG